MKILLNENTKLATLAATLITFGSLAGGANAALTISNWNKTATTLSFDLTGTITDNNPGSSQQNRLFIGVSGVSIGGDIVSSDTDGVAIENGGSTFPTIYPIIFNGFGASGNDVLQIATAGVPTYSGADYSVGDTFNYSISFTGLSNGLSVVDEPTISWGRTTYTDAPEAAHNVGGSAVPEPSSVILLNLGVLGLVARRKRTS
ncbi:PEP-CTERM sorting domain-containing protein [Akkermansiaceae bacterium]|nr:PEP-CTERM sorting domain-containing protein [Akkermansiaceae bacterium]